MPELSPAIPTTWICELSQLGLLVVQGTDAAKFLQGQLTCDIRELTDQRVRLGAQCNIKGRVLASFRLLQMDQDTIALLLPNDNLDITLKNLGKYIVFSKAKLHDYRARYRILGCFGETSETSLALVFPSIPNTIDTWTEHQGNYLIKIDHERFECWIKEEDYTSTITTLRTVCAEEPINAWRLLDIRAGVYWVDSSSSEQFTPHELNYPLINAVNFRKGCYTGQEIVARMHYRGKLKRHTHRLLIHTDTPLAPGEIITSGISTAAQLGDILSSATNEQGQIELLLVGNDDQVAMASQEKIKRLGLPYAIPNAEDSTVS